MAEHAVIATYRLSADGFGSEEEWEGIHLLERRLVAAIDTAGVGEFDGNEPSDLQVRLARVEL